MGNPGECCLAHLFFSAIICNIADGLGLPDKATEISENLHPEPACLRDLYLKPWIRFDPMPVMLESFPLAWRIGMVNGAMS